MYIRRIAILVVVAIGFHSAFAYCGPGEGGGGDSCEARIKVIAGDIEGWILSGGANRLRMNEGMTVDSYSKAMLKQLGKAHVKCVGPGDKEYPVKVYGVEKECKSYTSKHGPRIVCDRVKFYSTRPNPENDPIQYRLIHHEYATLAGLEKPNRDDSTYFLSNQITGFLENQIVKRLAVKPSGTPGIACENFTGDYVPKNSNSDAPLQIRQEGCDKMDLIYPGNYVRSFITDGVSRKFGEMSSGTVIYAQAYFSGGTVVHIYNYASSRGSYIRRDTWVFNDSRLIFDQKFFDSSTGAQMIGLGEGGEYERK